MQRAFLILAVMLLVFNYCWAKKKGKQESDQRKCKEGNKGIKGLLETTTILLYF